jgi:hypothetical protein
MKNILLIFSILFFFSCSAQNTQPEVTEIINNWYEEHKNGYELHIKGENVKVETSDFYEPTNKTAHKLIRINWEGMYIELCFNKPLSSFKWTGGNLKDNLNYFSLTNIYSDINLNGWKVYPRTPMSALHDGEGITFKNVEENKIMMEIDWETYTVFGYAQNKFCKDQLEIADSSMPSECFVGVRKTLPLKVLVDFEVAK